MPAVSIGLSLQFSSGVAKLDLASGLDKADNMPTF
jgi:hypothetical protein